MSPTAPDSLPPVVLASGSRYRRELLARLLPRFEVVVPGVDETRQAAEAPGALAQRLAQLKAAAVAATHPGVIVIGSDQVASAAGRLLGKPGTAERAIEQLNACNGRELTLHTAVCVLGPGPGLRSEHCDETTLRLRDLRPAEIERYVAREQPLDCAGSFKFEGLGVALFDSVRTADPAAIQGLPLLWLIAALKRHGHPVL
jgi:septum formation protein